MLSLRSLSAFVVYFARVTMGLLLPLDALEELDEVFCDLVLLVLEADGALAVVRLDAIVAEAPARSINIESRRWRKASDAASDA